MALVPFEDDSVTDEMVRRAERELGETEERRERTLKELRRRIKESQVVIYINDDTFLLTFLRVRKFNVDRAMNGVENLCHAKKDYADIFCITNFDEILQLLKDKVIGILPYRAENGSAIIVLQFEHFKFSQMKFSVFVRAVAAVALVVMISSPPTQICGLNVIIDTNKTSPTNLRFVSPRLLYLLGRGISTLFPARFKSIHFINAPTPVRVASNVIRSLLTDKLQQRYHFHANTQQALLKHFHPSVLPMEYGGSCVYDNSSLINKMKSLEQRYRDLFACGFKPEVKASDKK